MQRTAPDCTAGIYNSGCLECNPDYGWFWNRSGYSEADSLCVPANNGQQRIACNPILYGYAAVAPQKKVLCVDKKNDGGTSAACAKRSLVAKRATSPVEDLIRIVGQVNDLWSQTKSLCADYTTPPNTGSRVEDVGQKKECENLKTRVAAIKAEFCSAAKTKASNASKALKAACDQFQAPAVAGPATPKVATEKEGVEASTDGAGSSAAPATVTPTPVPAAPPAPPPPAPPPAAPAPVTTTTQVSAPPPPAQGGGSAPKSPQGGPSADCNQIETMLKSAEAVPQCNELAKPAYQNCGIMTGCDDANKVQLKKDGGQIKCTTGDNTTNSDIHKCACAPNGSFDTTKEIYICSSATTAAGSAVAEASPKKEANWLDKNWGGIFKVILAIFTAGLVYAITDNSAKAYDKNVKKIIDANPPTPPIPLPPPRIVPGLQDRQ